MAIEVPHLSVPIDAVSSAPAAEDDPLWYKDAIIYQAHVKAFFDSNNDGIGDFPGLTRKLDYLAGLGITCIWLLPFFPSPLKDDGYDISDYRSVHPSYGTLEDFRAFVRAAHERRIKVLIELVVNHTSDQHPWFQRARHAPAGSPERAFYVWSDTDKKFPETRIIFTDTERSNWAFDPVARQYYWHRFFSHQPDLNHNNPAVVEAVIDVMKFWLDLGVDALRLDAVPYLCVREGTNNENLPETHTVLKRMRRELDRAYRGRMLLAEANQWPADVRAYFGDGDECHMAFHFPLMPRMFMALQQEDRHAITEILNQTPDIPESCQWALFLRNHDELTLEMVTDEERDYMYSVYANDPQMRLNVGIRRRLAPLVENSRRRVELLHSLLFALPGTPTIYYGDEIGMGDNIYLGDRNGVRTPMQWSSDRNAGFSRADPARLYAPPIMDPVYGYEAINVEAQERFPFSLLTWMKRLIAMRKQHRVFGRGSLEFIYPHNRKVLAFLRKDERETILIVANLSRALQPAYLDLRQYEGLIPVEMTGLTEFPRIGGQPYFLTLGPYASYWFTLQSQPMQTAPRMTTSADPNTQIAESLPTLLMGGEWQNLLDSGTRGVLERQALRPFLQRQRWFASKAREIRHASFSDWAPIATGSTPTFLTIVTVEYTEGRAEAYLLPLALVPADLADHLLKDSAGAVVARIAGARKGAIVDAAYVAQACNAMLSMIAQGLTISSARGQVRGCSVGGSQPPPAADVEWSRPGVDQSNTVVFGSHQMMLKLFRRLEPSVNPEYELGRYLTERGFPRIPSLVGALEYDRAGLEPGTLAIVQAAVTHQGSGWEYTVDDLRRYFEHVAARTAPPAIQSREGREGPPPFFNALEHLYLTGATKLGQRTAELHLALAGSMAPAFAPEPCDRAALNRLADRMIEHGEGSIAMLRARIPTLHELNRTLADDVVARKDVLKRRFDAIRTLEHAGQLIRVHGDYHLGQVLRTEADFMIIDFEGEPARSIAERRSKQSPMKDVGGMLRSYSYAAYAALFAFTTHAPDRDAALQAWADTWQHWAAHSFLSGYTSAAGEASFLPHGEAWHALLWAFMLEKALYELEYELNHRPDWLRVPLLGIRKLVM